MELPRTTWVEFPFSMKVTFLSHDKEPEMYSVGDVVWFEGRQDGGVLITELIGNDAEDGPKGFTYRPWREEEKRWASLQLTLRGDPRFIICHPNGTRHSGLHINDWSTFRKVDHPDAACADFVNLVEQVKKK